MAASSRSRFAKGRIFCKCFKTGRTLAIAAYRLLPPCEPQYLVEPSLRIRCAAELFCVRRRLRMHTVLHAGTVEKGARSKRELVFTPFRTILLSQLS